MHPLRLAFIFAVPVLFGCSRGALLEEAGGSGGATTAAVTTSPSATSSTTSGFGGGFATSSGTGTSPACESAFIDVETPQASLHLVGSCPGSWGSNQSSRPVAYFSTGLAFSSALTITGCGDPVSSEPQIDLVGFAIDSLQPSTSPGVVVQYIDTSSGTWLPTQQTGEVTVTQMTDKTGQTLEGTFKGTVTLNGQVMPISGKFRACKVDDQNLP